MSSTHPYPPFIPENVTKLIIGTIPPPRFCKEVPELQTGDVNFYYGSKDNFFWPLLTEVFGEQFRYTNEKEAVEQRKDFLKKHNLGITDIIETCVHLNDSAKDQALQQIAHKDLRQLLTDHPSIHTLLYTSAFVKKQVNSFFHFQNISPLPYHSITVDDKEKQSLKIGGKTYQVRILYSPSPLALIGLGKNGAQKRIEQYRRFLTD